MQVGASRAPAAELRMDCGGAGEQLGDQGRGYCTGAGGAGGHGGRARRAGGRWWIPGLLEKELF